MSSQFKFNWSQFKFFNSILNCIKEKNRGTSSIQLNFLIHQVTVYAHILCWYAHVGLSSVREVLLCTSQSFFVAGNCEGIPKSPHVGETLSFFLSFLLTFFLEYSIVLFINQVTTFRRYGWSRM